MKKIAIITGGSKGIGKALCQKYSENGYVVFSIARTKSNLLNTEQLVCDVSNTKQLKQTITRIFSTLKEKDISHITLINNAGMLGDIAPIEKNNLENITQTVQVNLAAPIITTSLFIKYTKGWNASKKIINISSGAALNPYEGWSSYCSTKAGVDMLTKVVAEEQSHLKNGVLVASIYPGVVNTQMQTQIRNTSKENFAMLNKFVELYENEQLLSPNTVANNIFIIDTKKLIKNGSVIDIRALATS